MLKKLCFVVFLLCTTNQLISSDAALFRILEDTQAWEPFASRSFALTDSQAAMIIPKGSIVSVVSPPRPFFEINGNPSFIHNVIFEGMAYIIATNTFTPVDTNEMLDEGFLTDASLGMESNIWINSYFLEVLHSGNLAALVPHEQELVDNEMGDAAFAFSMHGARFNMSLTLTQGTISIGGLNRDEFWIQRIERTENGYRVAVTWNALSDFIHYNPRLRSGSVTLPDRSEFPAFDLYFIVDGDYLDVYYSTGTDDSYRIFSTSFALADAEMVRQIDGILKGDFWISPFQPSRIAFWPRRADGGMDFLPPAGSPAAREISAALAVPEAPAPVVGVPEEQSAPIPEADTEERSPHIGETQDHGAGLPVFWFIVGAAVLSAGAAVVLALRRKRS